ncbi:isoprenylcysteine carboxylmethyltransferase family protein [Candidatus Kaistella beijingensis]|uniref:methyltransferase family protein n=1 Tax=Candidatus Kaistella beijingensis TaxID=2820270 RepID=UPI001CC4484C|nr:isoprenylcysteine carboxylmethyltransferase family protein [Candidatus Kaistella beijingensis]UBB90380.1 isoprenylcysteine carboxylmethyltransferase family protein [Candidatus Kaistella beijingensis]
MIKTSKDYLFVSIQFLLFALYLFDFLPKFDILVIYTYLGLFFATLGMVISVISLSNLDENLTVFPTPKENSELITNGLYQFSRHPIYTGILLFVFGFAIFWESYYKLLISVLLLILFYLKTLYEEKQLKKKYPNYIHYQKVTGRFFPKIDSIFRDF